MTMVVSMLTTENMLTILVNSVTEMVTHESWSGRLRQHDHGKRTTGMKMVVTIIATTMKPSLGAHSFGLLKKPHVARDFSSPLSSSIHSSFFGR